MSQNTSKCLDYSLGGTSAESSMVKSWISIKDIKKMVSKPLAKVELEDESGNKRNQS
jgi:hypothetical protein